MSGSCRPSKAMPPARAAAPHNTKEGSTVKKIPTIFVREGTGAAAALVTQVWNPLCEWVRDGEGVATVKYDGTAVLIRHGQMFKRREVKPNAAGPADFEQVDFDSNTGKSFGWIPVGLGPEDRYHREAFASQGDGTYELVGPKVQGNKHDCSSHFLVRHGNEPITEKFGRTFDGIRVYLKTNEGMEGIVWHHSDGRMAKIKRRDFGFTW